METQAGETFEWVKNPLSREVDGFELKRIGNHSVGLRVYLRLEYLTERYRLSHELARLLGLKEETKPTILLSLWRFVKNLENPENRSDLESFQKTFGAECLTNFNLVLEKVNGHLLPAEPTVLEYPAASGPDNNARAVCYDISVELPELPNRDILSMPISLAKEMSFLDQKISEMILVCHKLNSKREFLKSFSENPIRFTREWLQCQSRKVETCVENLRIPSDKFRSCAFYQDESWTSEAIFQYLNSKFLASFK